jgi:Zn-dependent protease/CBS domain-containing protein
MKWSWRIGSISGIGLYVHATFVLLLAWIGIEAWSSTGHVMPAVIGVLFVIAVFLMVVLHELGHAFAARRYGVRTRDIILLPIGGVARLDRMPKEPKQELVIAFAGPAVNVAIALAMYAWLTLTGGIPSLADGASIAPDFLGRGFLIRLFAVNVWLVLFNLIPAFPMDGGRVLRALLAMRSGDYTAATETAARIGRYFALLFGILGLFVFHNTVLVVIALFVWLSAAGEAAAAQTSALLDGVPLQRLMITDVHTLRAGDPLSRAVQLILDGFQQDFPVVEGEVVIGMLTRPTLMTALAERGDTTRVGDVMQRDFPRAAVTEPVEAALARLKGTGSHSLPVLRDGHLLGVLTMENVGEYVMVQAALRGDDADFVPA